MQNQNIEEQTNEQFEAVDSKPSAIEAFTFGEAVPMLDQREIFDYLHCSKLNKWYEPPVSFSGLAKTFRAAAHHGSPLYMKRNILTSMFVANQWFSKLDFTRYVMDYLIFGNAFLEIKRNRLGGLLKITPSLAKYTRVGTEAGKFYYTATSNEPYEFPNGSVFHLLDPDINQEIYGLPQYLASLSSTWLNESATLFRRKYYLNGSHAGFIMYLTDAAHKQQDVDALRDALKNAKGPGNFRNLFMYAPMGKKDGLQVIPLAEVAAKDEFLNIKNVTRDDMLASHRTPPQLMGIIPGNVGGFGDVEKAARVFAVNELMPICERLKDINDYLGVEVVRFEDYRLLD